jgi:hypothetical protein
VQVSLRIPSPHQVHWALSRTIGWRGSNQAVGGWKLMAEWWRNKGNLACQPCHSTSTSVTIWWALQPRRSG